MTGRHATDPVVVVGAGLAGLSCAVELTRRDIDVVVIEASDDIGGRVRTDIVDGLRLDRGFQLLNPAYPALEDLVDLAALDLRQFGAGIVVASGGRRSVLADPRRSASDVSGVVDSETGSVVEKVRFGIYVALTALGSGQRLKHRPDKPWGEALDDAGIDGELRERVLNPFLSGVLGELDGSSSRIFVDLLLRTFARGTPGVPALGMQELPKQLASQLTDGIVHLDIAAEAVDGHAVYTADATWSGVAVVIATDAASCSTLTGLAPVPQRGLTTYYHRAEYSPASRPFLHVDGDRDGPVVNTAVMTDVAPTYAESGALIESTVVGAQDDAEQRAAATRQLSRIYGVDTAHWDLVATYAIPGALPAAFPGFSLRQPVDLGDGLFLAGDHRDTPSIQGAIVSGRRAARAVSARLAAPVRAD